MKTYTNDARSFNALKRRQKAICSGVALMNKALFIASEVVKTMDGKAMNKRLITAIQGAIDKELGTLKVSVRLEWEYSGKATLVFGLYDRSYPDSEPDSNGYSTCSYFDNEVYSHVYTDCMGAIEINKIVGFIQNAIDYNLRTAYKYTDAVKHFKSYLTKYEKALESFRKVYATLNPLLVSSDLSNYELTKGYSYPKESVWEEERDKALNL